MTRRKPPSQRDTTSLEHALRHMSRAGLSAGGPGYVGGRFAGAQPITDAGSVDPDGEYGEGEDGANDDLFPYEDRFVITAGQVTARLANLVLTYEPIAPSEHVFWLPDGGAGLYVQSSEWSRVDRILTVTDTAEVLSAGDVVVVEYLARDADPDPIVAPVVDELDLADLPLVGWFSADYEAAAYADGATMAGWTNLVAGGTDAAGDAVFRASGGPGGGPRLTLATQQLTFAGLGFQHGDTPTGIELMCVVKSGPAGTRSSFFNFGSNNLDTYYTHEDGWVREDIGSTLNADYTPTLAVDQWRTYDSYCISGDRAIRIDGELQFSSSALIMGFPVAAPSLGLGAGFPQYTGSISALLLFDAKLTDAQRAQAYAFLQDNPSGGLP